MANAKKCDVCGNLYERYGTKYTDATAIRLLHEIVARVNEYSSIVQLDCCPDCMREINNTIDLLKNSAKKEE